MALIIQNEKFTLSDSGLEITGLAIAALPGSWMVKSPENVQVTPQVNAFATIEKAFESVSNYLKIEGFPTNWDVSYQYGVDDVNFMYWLDLKIKEKILSAYPDIDESNVIVTTELPEG